MNDARDKSTAYFSEADKSNIAKLDKTATTTRDNSFRRRLRVAQGTGRGNQGLLSFAKKESGNPVP